MGPCQLPNIGHGTMSITKHWTWDHVNYKTNIRHGTMTITNHWTWNHGNNKTLEPCQLQNNGHGTMAITKHWTWNHGNYKTVDMEPWQSLRFWIRTWNPWSGSQALPLEIMSAHTNVYCNTNVILTTNNCSCNSWPITLQQTIGMVKKLSSKRTCKVKELLKYISFYKTQRPMGYKPMTL